jgi:SAM-dependent methyltransferase
VPEVTAKDFAALFGLPALPPPCAELAAKHDFRYEVPTSTARERIVAQVTQHVDSDKPTQVGEHRAAIWESCWSDNLQKFIEGGFDPDKLVPDFIKPGQPIRLKQDYVIPANPRFELDFFQVCRAFLFDCFLKDTQAVYEFGCGSGFNLLALAQQLPGKKLCGLDWSRSSNETLDLMGKKLGLEISGRNFDFFRPDAGLELGPRSGVLTMCALEQVGPRHGSFVEFLLTKKPAVCVNMEPLVELYDAKNPVDALAIRFHRKRGYLEGFLTGLRSLAGEGRVEILEERRFYFGSIYHEGYSYVAWRPR